VKVRYTLPAAADLDDLLRYIADRSPKGARNVQARIRAVEQMLARHPKAGLPTRFSWLRRMTTSPYPFLIFYEPADGEIIIHAIRHGARDPESMPE
jgi:toxin ParE1/3/4